MGMDRSTRFQCQNEGEIHRILFMKEFTKPFKVEIIPNPLNKLLFFSLKSPFLFFSRRMTFFLRLLNFYKKTKSKPILLNERDASLLKSLNNILYFFIMHKKILF